MFKAFFWSKIKGSAILAQRQRKGILLDQLYESSEHCNFSPEEGDSSGQNVAPKGDTRTAILAQRKGTNVT